MTIQFLRRIVSARAGVLLLGAMAAVPAMAAVELRVEARPLDDPIQAFITVTDAMGNAVAGLAAGDFTATLDGNSVTIQGLTLPPSQDPTKRVSVVFVMDYSGSVVNAALTGMQDATIAFANAMNDGDYAAIVKFNDTNPERASVVLPFTQIDHADNSQALEDAVMADYPGDGTNLLDALLVAINHILAPPSPLPAGPKAIILVSDGGELHSDVTESEVIALANANSVPVFSVGVGDLANLGNEALLTTLGTETGGDFFPAPTGTEIVAAYASISTLLNNEYLLSIPSGISDCAVHTLQVTVTNLTPVSATFTRRVCDTAPNPFTFTNQTGVEVNTSVTSNTVTITGLEVPADISTQIGTYSIGCNGTFTGVSGTISNGETVCVRHTSSAAVSTSNTTTLTIGGVSGAFTSTTRAASGGGGGGGGGATGGLELLTGLALLFARRRRRA